MIEGFDQGPEGQPHRPADYGHSGLEKAEVPGQPKGLPGTDTGQAGPGGQGDGEGIHRQGQGNQQYRSNAHGVAKLRESRVLPRLDEVIKLVPCFRSGLYFVRFGAHCPQNFAHLT